MELLNPFLQNILSPPILFFILGGTAGFLKSDLEIPDAISKYLSIYLMMSIGFKGGVSICGLHLIDQTFFILMGIVLLIGFLNPFLGFFFLKKTTCLDVLTMAATAAHYGSVSVVTFVTSLNFLQSQHIDHKGYITAILALMEFPAILSGLMIAKKYTPSKEFKNNTLHTKKEMFTNSAVILLLGSFLIGALTGNNGMKKMEHCLVLPFQGFLSLFLMDMGIKVSRHFHDLKLLKLNVLSFGVYMPILGATLGILISYLIGLDQGTSFLFTVMLASASYIAVTAAMRLVLPDAKMSVYLPLSLAVTFPFNISIGLPFYFYLIQLLIR